MNTRKLWRFLLRRKLPGTLLTGMRFTTFGLGDSSYPRYNWAIRKIHKRLQQLGAREFADRGEGDEMSSEGIERMFDAWHALVAENLLALRPLKPGEQVIPHDVLLPPRYTLEVDESKLKKIAEPAEAALSREGVLTGRVSGNKRMTASDHFQDVRHLCVESETPISYVPGDVVALFPRNTDEDVATLIEHQGWGDIADRPATVNDEFASAVEGGLVTPVTLRTLLTHHLDIMAIPRRSFFSTAWHFSDDERERERLHEFSTLEGLDDLYDYANRPRRSILETITEFSTLKIPLAHVLDVLPILRPRLFSIASADTGANEFELAIAIVKYKTIIRRIRRGVCTRWVEGLEVGDRIPFTVISSPLNIKGAVHLSARSTQAAPDASDATTATTSDTIPTKPQASSPDILPPVVMVGPGTGVAPMRNLLDTFAPHYPADKRLLLFFGCRFREKDFLFEADWKRLADSGKLELVTAFSRDKDGGGYVQDRIFAHSKRVVELIVDSNGVFYVCGSAGAMPRQVRITLAAAIAKEKGWSDSDAESYVSELERTGRYLQETW